MNDNHSKYQKLYGKSYDKHKVIVHTTIKDNRNMEDDDIGKYVMVAGIDFGTTFSGYGFSFKGTDKDIKLTKNWRDAQGFLVGIFDRLAFCISRKRRLNHNYYFEYILSSFQLLFCNFATRKRVINIENRDNYSSTLTCGDIY